ncbi:MAG: glycosyltransferase [bacterium]|nr:MAG: glycosyltransferase [bacterium]
MSNKKRNFKKISILFITPGGRLYGAHRSLLYILKYIDKTKFRPITFSILDGPLTQNLKSLGIKVYLFQKKTWFPSLYRSKIGGLGKAISWLFVIKQIINIIKKNKVNIVYVNSSVVIFSAIAAKLMKCKVVCHVREIFFPGIKRQILTIFTRFLADKIIGVTQKIEQLFPENTVVKKYQTIHNGIDLSEYNSKQDKEEMSNFFGIKKEDVVIGLVSQIIEHKGIEYFLETVKNLTPVFPQLKAFIVGDAPPGAQEYENFIYDLSQKWNLNKNLIFTGFLKNVIPIISNFDMLVLTSLREALPRTILEAMALEKPVVATSVGGVSELIVPNVTGIIVPPKDSKALSKQIQYLLEHKHVAIEMGRNGRLRVEKNFDIKNIIIKIEKSLEVLVNYGY